MWDPDRVPIAAVDGLEVFHEVVGSGPRVLLIGGSGGDLRSRPGLLDSPLSTRFEVLAYDQRGLGRSDKPPGPYSMAGYADDAAGLLAALGWEGCAVMGVSFGGMVAQEVAIRHPGAVERLVLCCTSSGGAGGASYPLHDLADLADDERGPVGIGLSDSRRGSDWQAANPEHAARLVEQATASSRVGAGEAGREDGARLQLEARRTHDTWDRLPGITAPTLVCAGRYDGIAPVANSEALAARIPDARLEIFDGGHLFLLQDPRSWDVIAEFLAVA